MASPDIVAEKAFDEDALKRTVQTIPPWQGAFANSFDTSTIFLAAAAADEMAPWGSNVKLRDKQLREWITTESIFTSALATVIARNSAFSWKIEGPDQSVEDMQEVLTNANFGLGWANFIAKLSIDLYTQDNGAFFEIIRESDSEKAKVVGIANIDAGRCWHTGLPETPVLYQDRLGVYHLMKWYQVCAISEIPAPYETLPGLQYCALTRLLHGARIMRDTITYLKEKIGGRNPRSVTLVQGVTAQQIKEAWAIQRMEHDNAGLMRFTMPLMVSSVDPLANLDFKTLEIAGLPDGFDLDLQQKQYIALLAMAFLSDYQEFAPLPGGNLGTSAQSEILHQKTQGKGPGLFMKAVTNAINFNVLPANLEFGFDEVDPEADQTQANIKMLRAQSRNVRITSGEISPEVARMIALESGDLTQEQYDFLENQAKEAQQAQQAQQEAQAAPAAPESTTGESVDDAATANAQQTSDQVQETDVSKTTPERIGVENVLASIVDDAFTELYNELLGELTDE